MIRNILLATLSAFAFHATAQACSCSPAESEAEKRDQARRIAMKAIAIVEVEPVSQADMQSAIGETYRVLKVEAGSAKPGIIRMARSFGIDRQTGSPWMSATSCDVFPTDRKRVLLMRAGYQREKGGDIVPAYTMPGTQCGQVLPVQDAPANLSSDGFVPVYSFGGTCDDYALSEPGMIDMIRQEARRMKLPLR
jgi:hypothetical protein